MQVTIARNSLDPSTWETFETENFCAFLMDQFPTWPENARFYNQDVAEICDVTPVSSLDFERMNELDGPIYVIIYPGWIPVIIMIVIMVAASVAMMLMMKPPQVPTARNTNDESPNNSLSDRTNKARPNARIPDIYGTVRSTPDLIAPTYKIFENNEEKEISFMCFGRGSYEIPENEIRDDTTRATDIGGMSVEIYGPNTSPNSGDEPEIQIGNPILSKVYTTKRSTAVNGQVLRPPNDQRITGDEDIYFKFPNEIHINSDSDQDFTDFFVSGDSLIIMQAYEYESYVVESQEIYAHTDGSINFEIPTADIPALYVDSAGLPLVLDGARYTPGEEGSPLPYLDFSGQFVIESVDVVTIDAVYWLHVVLVDPGATNDQWDDENFTEDIGPMASSITVPDGAKIYNLDGTYTILSVSGKEIILSSPELINADWLLLEALDDEQTEPISPVLYTTGPKWIGPFTLDVPSLSRVFCNYVALNGLYKDNGQNQRAYRARMELKLQPINADGSTRGGTETFRILLTGSAVNRSTVAGTLKADPTFHGRCLMWSRRVSQTDMDYKGTVVDEIKWRDAYAVSNAGRDDFGDVTTAHVVTYATTGALAVKERKFNALVTRKLPARIEDDQFTETLFATNDAATILSAVCLDPYIGRRSSAQIDFANIFDMVEDVEDYFGSSKATEFCYTFDSNNLSSEETIQAIARAVFCSGHRRGTMVELSFERETEDSILLFNHRNKIPGSEVRVVRFGNQSDWDGIEYQWVSPDDDAVVTYYLPEDRSARNPRKIESVGVRNGLQAHFHAWREWQKIRYQNEAVEFEALQEAFYLAVGDRILVADNTRTGTYDGEITEQNVLALTLSQEMNFEDGVAYTIILQMPDGTVQSIPIIQGASAREVVLTQPPRLPLVVDQEMYAKTTYMIVANDSSRETAFLVSELDPQNNFTVVVKATNYDNRFYSMDTDFIDGIVNEDGEIL